MGKDQLLITGWVPILRGLYRGIVGKKKVVFRTDLTAPTEITGDSAQLLHLL